MQTFISPLGFDTSHILSLINYFGIKENDQVFLLQSDNGDSRANNAFEDAENVIKKLRSDVKVERKELNYRDFHSMVLEIVDIINDSSILGIHENPVIVNLSGGPREILVALTNASTILSNKIAHFTQYSDISRELNEIEILYPNKQDEKTNQILNFIKFNSCCTLGDIAEHLQLSDSKVSRVCARLNTDGYININKVGKTKCAEISFKGIIALRL